MAAKKRNRRTGRSTASTGAEASTSTQDPDAPAQDAEEQLAADEEASSSSLETAGEDPDDGEGTAARSRRAAKDPVRRKKPSVAAKASPAAKDATRAASARTSAEAERTRTTRRRVAAPAPNPQWLAPFAVTMLILGLVYLVTYYLSAGQLPLPIGDWNLAVGFGLMMVGGGALMFWK